MSSDRGNSHQVKVFSPAGKPLRTIGRPGAPKAGPYDPQHMNNPNGLTIDAATISGWPRPISSPSASASGHSTANCSGPSTARRNTAAAASSIRRTRPASTIMAWSSSSTGSEAPTGSRRVFYRPGPADLRCPTASAAAACRRRRIYRGGRRYFTNCYNSNPTNGAAIAFLWIERDGIAVPVAALGRAKDWNLLKGDAFKPRWPQGRESRAATTGGTRPCSSGPTSTATARCSPKR